MFLTFSAPNLLVLISFTLIVITQRMAKIYVQSAQIHANLNWVPIVHCKAGDEMQGTFYRSSFLDLMTRSDPKIYMLRICSPY